MCCQVCSAEDLTDEVAAMIQGVVLSLPEGSLTQRIQVRAGLLDSSISAVSSLDPTHSHTSIHARTHTHPQAEYLRELLSRVGRYNEQDPRAAF